MCFLKYCEYYPHIPFTPSIFSQISTYLLKYLPGVVLSGDLRAAHAGALHHLLPPLLRALDPRPATRHTARAQSREQDQGQEKGFQNILCPSTTCLSIHYMQRRFWFLDPLFVKLRRGSGKDRQGMAPKAKGLKA